MTLSGTEVPPQRRKAGALGRQALAVLLAACLVALAPGLDAYQAFAGGFQKGPAGPSAIPSLTLPQAPSIPGAALPGAGLNVPALPSIPQLPASAVSLPAGAALPQGALPGQAAIPQAAAAGPIIPGAAIPGATVPGAANAPAQTTQGLVQQAVARINAAQSAHSDSGVAGALESLFTGGKAAAASVSDGVAGSQSAGPAPLSPLPLDELKTIARDGGKPDAERQAAVKAIADRSSDAAKLALEEIGTERGGGPADYEIKRAALRKLAEQGKVVSLPPVSDEHAKIILDQLAKNKPEVAAFDYDGTLEKSGAPASAETGAALKALADSGVQTMILTDRSENGRREGDVGILESLATLTPAQRAAISLGANRGARILSFDSDGRPQLVSQSAKWTDAERAAVTAAAAKVAAKYGLSQAALQTDYDAAVFLPANLSGDKTDEAARELAADLAAAGVKASVVPRRAHDEGETPYVTVTKYDKSLGSAKLRALRETLDRFRDAEKLPKALRPLARKILAKLPSKATPAASALLVGDHFFGMRGIDADMIKGAPGALAISVGGTADPRLDNAFVWNKQGHDASMELARAASGPAAPQMEGMNWKAFGGLFSSRTFSIVAFLGTTLAYAKVAIGAVGPAQFGTLAALGGLVSIAAGPLTGKIADKFSARTGMALNTILRAVFLLDLPTFTAFGILNFWTLLAGSVANGWLLSSIMTTEGAYLRRLFGYKNLRTANSLLQLNYFFLQIIFGLVLGIGSLVDGHNPMIPFYIASAVNAFLVLPIIWKTMPTVAPNAGPAAAQSVGAAAAPKASVAASIAGFVRQYWKEALLLVGAMASFPVLHSALPITGALVWWIARTPGFKAIKADKPIISAVAMLSMGAFLFYALQSFALPTIAAVLVGKANSSLMLGKMLGAVFLGQMVSSSSMAKLPIVRLPFVGRFGIQRLVQAAVVGVTGLWVFTGLFPGSVLAAGAFMAAAGAMIFAAHYITDKGWIKLVGAGLGFIALPAFFWGNIPILLGSLAVFGYFYGPASVALSAYIQRRAPPEKIGQIMGIQGSLFNAAISLGIGTASLIAGMLHPMFPSTLAALAGIGGVLGAIYFLGSRKLPGLPSHSIQTKQEGNK